MGTHSCTCWTSHTLPFAVKPAATIDRISGQEQSQEVTHFRQLPLLQPQRWPRLFIAWKNAEYFEITVALFCDPVNGMGAEAVLRTGGAGQLLTGRCMTCSTPQLQPGSGWDRPGHTADWLSLYHCAGHQPAVRPASLDWVRD